MSSSLGNGSGSGFEMNGSGGFEQDDVAGFECFGQFEGGGVAIFEMADYVR